MSTRAAAPANGRAKARKRSVADARKGIDTSNKAGAALIDPEKPLTDAQQAFVKFWGQGDSVSLAANRAGIETTYAYRLIYMPNILKAYQAEKAAYERDSGMTRAKVIAGFEEAIDMARTMAEPSTMVAAWREVGKMCGYYEPVKVEHTVNHQGKIIHERLDKLSNAELFDLIQKQSALIQQAQPALTGELHDDDDDAAGAAS